MARCAYRVFGDVNSPPVVLLHAIATDSALWTPQVPVWSTAFRLICIDLPGHGASPACSEVESLQEYADCILEVLDEMMVSKASIVGLSFGGMIAQAFALSYPQRLVSLVLAHTSVRTEEAVQGIWESRASQLANGGMAAQVEATLQRWFTRAFSVGSPLTLDWLSLQITRTTPEGYLNAIRAIQSLDHLERLIEISAPALVVVGEADSAVPPAAGTMIAERIQNSTLVVLKDCAHLGNLEQPVLFTETVGRFLVESQHGDKH